MKRLAALAACALAACQPGNTGTIQLALTAAPGSPILDTITHLRVTLTQPRLVVEADRTETGFALALEVEADGTPGALVVEGFDASGMPVAAGQSPVFSVAGIDARIVVYLGIPLSIDRAPVSLSPARNNISSTQLPYGAIFAGGTDATTLAPSDAVAIYNAFDHSLTGGKPMPAPRDGVALAAGLNGAVYLYGGRDTTGNATGTFWLLDTTFAPSGVYFDLGDHPGFPRADEVAISIATDRYVISGTPPLDAQGNTVNERTGVAPLAATGSSVVLSTGARTAILVDTTGNLVRFRADTFDPIDASPRPGAAVAPLPDGRFLVVGGGTADEMNDLVVVDAAGGTATVIADALTVPRTNAAVAVTSRHVVIAGGGLPEILDATTLASLGTRAAPDGPDISALALPNDQVLLVGAEGALYLFTPPPPTFDQP